MINMASKKFRCCNCESISTADSINNTTLNNCCANRQQRRQYVPIEKTKQTDPKWYQCPICKQNIRRRGWQEIIKSVRELIDDWIDSHDGDDYCHYCIHNGECSGMTQSPNGPIEPPCCSTDIKELLDTNAILTDIMNGGI